MLPKFTSKWPLMALILGGSLALSLVPIFRFSKTFEPLPHLATKTPYSPPSFQAAQIPGLEQCHPVHINFLGRHGSRHLISTAKIDKLELALLKAQQENQLKTPGGTLLLKLLQEARLTQTPSNLGQLSEQGRVELALIAERMHKEFEKLFATSSENKPVVLLSTNFPRTKESLATFLRGLIKLQPGLAKHAVILDSDAHQCDPTLEFYHACNAYKAYKRTHPKRAAIEQSVWTKTAKADIKKILNRFLYRAYIEKLSDTEQIAIARHLYDLCQLDADLNRSNAKNGFCSFFARATEIEYFNWQEDALAYFTKGYAGQSGSIAHHVACLLLKNFIMTTQQVLKEPSKSPIAHLRFAHAETLIPVLVLMGLYRDDTPETMLKRPEQRKFRTSRAAPMAGNVQWTLYQCPNLQYRVRMTHNENNISFPIPGCEDSPWCEFERIKSFYEQEGRLCDAPTWQKDICQGTTCVVQPEIAY